MNFYPLKFQPIYQYRIWGGDKLKTILNKNISTEHIGESWEISDVDGNQTLVANGEWTGKTLKELIRDFRGKFVGEKVYRLFGEDFPLLIKFIDAKLPLSIQVHPSDELAKIRHNSFGKNEMWYVMQADDNSEIIVGFDEPTSKEKYQSYLDKGKILDLLHVEKPQKGDTYHIPTGRVHAIGSGILLAEIQQTSDVTYRIYDYNRVDAKTGKLRELHTELALDALDFSVAKNYKTQYKSIENTANTLVHTPYFNTNIYFLDRDKILDYSNLDSFVILLCVDGSFQISGFGQEINVHLGETILLPASLNSVKILTERCTVIEVFF